MIDQGDLRYQFSRSGQSSNFIIGSDTTELELSRESRSFVNRVNDQVRKRQKRICNVAREGEEHSIIWRMFMAVTMESATFMGKNFQDTQNFIVNTTDLTLKQMFDISAKSVIEQLWKRLVGKNIHGIICHKLVMKESSIFNSRKFILYFVLGRSIKIGKPTKLGRKGQNESQFLKVTETMTESVESRLNSSGTSS